MSETKFTPGPWKAVVTTCEDDIEFFGAEPDEDLIGGIAHPMHSGLDYETTQANASLIAAAPDLYAPCADIERILMAEFPDIFEYEGNAARLARVHISVETLRNIMRACAKARGEEKGS